MAFEIPPQKYSGSIKTVTIGKGDKALTLGGETSYPFYLFEGVMPNKPRIALEVWDKNPGEDWAAPVLEVYKDVLDDPVAWAQKCVNEFGADAVALVLASTDPNGDDASPESAAQTAKKVAEAIDVPLIIYGTSAMDKDAEVLAAVAEACEGHNVILGPLQDKNYKKIGAAALGYQHTVVANTPIDVNLAKQLNILLGNLGVPDTRILVDPTTGGLGYGMEYSYSVVERDRMAALTQEDEKLQLPILNYIGHEVWKVKECKLTNDQAPELGDQVKRGILMEAITGVSLLLAGSDLLIMRHPEAAKLVKGMIDELTT
ncbi:MAG: acetyl-CoA decarbonylase/synthase complex subunit delta [Deltaproteobacteria bacterium]|nr:MAG: acetyl-CoA decarbonylase/synthase complex subunit delta [Deltaproteobacteria bacterium]